MKNISSFFSKKITNLIFLLFLGFSVCIAQNKEVPKTEGISVSPAHFHLNLKPGQTKTYEISVTNDTKTSKKFKVGAFDFNMNGKGKSTFLPNGTGKYSLSKWMSISPSFIEVKAGVKKVVKFTVEVPDDESGNYAAWSVIMIEQEEPRNTIEPPKKGEGTVALGVIPTFAFGIFVYQNPPNVSDNSVEITNFTMDETEKGKIVKIEAENTGNGIAYCTSYIDLTNLTTGEQQRLLVKRFTIVPELIRDFAFKLPDSLKKGQYLAVGVLDFEGSEEIQVAKMKFENK
ncbi:MAG: DUF916 domain-containing protein [Flavobacteriales bacterium]|nr:DUF916 domain-containing protein [Flavobacteriales bacterium]